MPELLTDRETGPQRPDWLAGVIVHGRDGLRFQPMRWGLVPSCAKDPSFGSKLINARCETLAEKPAFRRALRSRRCIVPISGFYEWQRQGRGKQPYFVTSPDGKPLTLAGLWEEWNGLLTFAVITAPPTRRWPRFTTGCRPSFRGKTRL